MENRKNYSWLTRELLETKVVMMEANALHNYRTILLKNLNEHTPSADIESSLPSRELHYVLTYKHGECTPSKIQFFNSDNILCESVSDDGDEVVASEPMEDERRVLVLSMTGPITRNGGLCSYGSKDYRDLLVKYASDDSFVGMVLVTDTPGGTCFAMYDFAQGIEEWHKAGKRSVQFIDCMSLSAGVALGAQCQRIVAMNKHDRVGCIGAMLAGWATADGTHDADGNRYIDVTATQTPDKNADYRNAAGGDYKILQNDVDKFASDFLDVLAKCRPQVIDEQKTGKVYEAGDVIGSLVDGIGNFESAVAYARDGEETWNTEADNDDTNFAEAPDVQDDPINKADDEDPEDTQGGAGRQNNGDDTQGDGDSEDSEERALEDGDSHVTDPAPQNGPQSFDGRIESLIARMDEMNRQMQAHSQKTATRISELEREAASLRQRNVELQADLRRSDEELNSMRNDAPRPAMPAAARQKSAGSHLIPTRISDEMTPSEKLSAWKHRGEQLAKARLS